MPFSPDLTAQLRRCSAGDREIAEAVLAEVLPELHKIAVQALRRERYMAPLDPTELINEVWIRNFSKGGWKVESRNHFFAIAAQAMRWVLVDNARHRLAQCRKDAQGAVSIDEVPGSVFTSSTDLEEIVRLGALMEKLEKYDRAAAHFRSALLCGLQPGKDCRTYRADSSPGQEPLGKGAGLAEASHVRSLMHLRRGRDRPRSR